VGDAAPLPQALGRWQSIPADASVRSMTERVDAAAPGAQAPAWIAGGGLLVIGIAVTVLLVAIAHSGGNWRGGGPAVAVDGGAVTSLRGPGRPGARKIVLQG